MKFPRLRKILESRSLLSADSDERFVSASDLAVRYRKVAAESDNCEYAALAFSMDRPLQLEAMIRSFIWATNYAQPITTIYKASTSRMKKAYNEVREIYSSNKSIMFWEQSENSPFKDQVLNTLRRFAQDRIFFLVDDIVFINKVIMQSYNSYDLSQYVASLRLGEDINFSYMTNESEALPLSLKRNEPLLEWDWAGNDIDWSYPLSIDGNIFSRVEMLAMLEMIEFETPNQLEANLQIFNKAIGSRKGVCQVQPILVNIPINRVQNDFPNRNIGNLSPLELLEKWEDGYVLNIAKIERLKSNSVHAQCEVSFQKRTFTDKHK